MTNSMSKKTTTWGEPNFNTETGDVLPGRETQARLHSVYAKELKKKTETLRKIRVMFPNLSTNQADRVPEEIRTLRSLRGDDLRRRDLLRNELDLEKKKFANLVMVHREQLRAAGLKLEAMNLQLDAMNVHSGAMEMEKRAEALTSTDKTDIAVMSLLCSLGETTIRWISSAAAISSALYCLI